MKRLLYLGFAVIVMLIFNSCDTPLSKYEPKNDEERNIIALLNTYLNSRNNGDINTLTSLFHDNGMYIAGNGATFDKKGIGASKPEWWVQYGKTKLLNSEFKIDGNNATVTSTGKWGVAYKNPHVCTLVKENDKWLFIKIKTGN